MDQLQKPFLKWLGGKSQIMHEILSKFPTQIRNYHEVFLGGGSVLLALLSFVEQGKIEVHGKIFAYDINSRLIHVYKHIQTNPDALYDHLEVFVKEYDSLRGTTVHRTPQNLQEAKSSKESYFYWLRKKFNQMEKDTLESSALFIFLNKTCFRGMYREGRYGYNVPYGHYRKTPTFISKEDLRKISALIQKVEFQESNFSTSIGKVEKGDFVYLDPPYALETPHSFVGYVADGFKFEMHQLLFEQIKSRKDIQFLMSNAKVNLVIENFKNYRIIEIVSRRSIHPKEPNRKTTEVLIYNY